MHLLRQNQPPLQMLTKHLQRPILEKIQPLPKKLLNQSSPQCQAQNIPMCTPFRQMNQEPRRTSPSTRRLFRLKSGTLYNSPNRPSKACDPSVSVSQFHQYLSDNNFHVFNAKEIDDTKRYRCLCIFGPPNIGKSSAAGGMNAFIQGTQEMGHSG